MGPRRIHDADTLYWDLEKVVIIFGKTKPSVSTKMWRFLPRTFLPPSYPHTSAPTPVVFADYCESAIAALD